MPEKLIEAQKPVAEPTVSPVRKKYPYFPAHYTDEQIEYEVECMYRMTQNMYR